MDIRGFNYYQNFSRLENYPQVGNYTRHHMCEVVYQVIKKGDQKTLLHLVQGTHHWKN